MRNVCVYQRILTVTMRKRIIIINKHNRANKQINKTKKSSTFKLILWGVQVSA